MTPERRALLREIARSLRAPLLFLLAYLVVRVAFALLTEHVGLVTPSGQVSLAVVAFGVLTLLARLIVLFVLPALVVQRVASRLLGPPRS